MELRAKLLETELTLRELMELQPGDIIPVEMPENLLVFVEDLPTFHAKMGRTKDNVALKITDKLKRPEGVKTEMHLVTRAVYASMARPSWKSSSAASKINNDKRRSALAGRQESSIRNSR